MRSPGSASWAHARAHERTIGPCLLRGACARRRDHRLRRKHGDGFGSCRCASPSACLCAPATSSCWSWCGVIAAATVALTTLNKKLQAYGLRLSMIAKGNCSEQPSIDTFFKTPKRRQHEHPEE